MASLWSLVLALATAVSAVSAACVEDGGNWYCKNVNSITYNNFGMSGTYDKVLDMNGCKTTKQAYSGSLAPLNEEVTLVFRGPIHLKQFAAYAPGSSSPTKHAKRSATERRHAHDNSHEHAHAHFHKRENVVDVAEETTDAAHNATEHEIEKRKVIVATWNNAVFSWTTDVGGAAEATLAPAPVKAAPEAEPTVNANVAALAAAPQAKAPGKTLPKVPVVAGDMAQVASYHAGQSKADGLVFLKQFYGPLSYCAADAKSTATSPNVLEDVFVPSNQEFTIWTDQKCSGQNGDCGYHNPGIPAYHGFSGSTKAFLFEFSMPHDSPSPAGLAPDAPAIWLLNSQITRTDQYGCSCWQSGCGEFDLFEVLTRGDERMKSTLHDAQSLGSSDYFTRPTGGSVKAAVVMGDYSATIKILEEGFVFGESLTQAQIKSIVEGVATLEKLPN